MTEEKRIASLTQAWLKIDPNGLETALKRGLPEKTQAVFSTAAKGQHAPYLEMGLYGRQDYSFEFSVYRDRGRADELVACVDNVYAVQGSDFALQADRNFAQVCEGVGITKTTTTATRMFSSLASLRGFLPDQKDWETVRETIKERVKQISTEYPDVFSPQLQERLNSALQSDDPRAHRIVASVPDLFHGHRLGQVLTAGWEKEFFPNGPEFLHDDSSVGWHGVRDLNDPESRQLHEAYLRGTSLG